MTVNLFKNIKGSRQAFRIGVSLLLMLLGLNLITLKAWAQMEGNSSEEFFEQGSQETEQEIETLENQQPHQSTEEREEQNLVHPILREPNTPSLETDELRESGVIQTNPNPDGLGELDWQE
ncbi:hypothetical protein [Crocosphaera sp. Alani8]|uniref:hypothetical protein n=1 Tax=Crocosphaera sp. Alani8 TaxID=3038952 RepID=UPI00313BE21F